MSQTANYLIENSAIARDVARGFGIVALHDREWRDLVGSEFVAFFESEPNGETDKYRWTTVKVDQLINLKVFPIGK